MNQVLSKTLQHGNFDSVFTEVKQPEVIDWTTQGELRLFHLDIRNAKINTEELKKLVYKSIGDYVFSRAEMENFTKAGNRDFVVAQALRELKRNGGADKQGSGGELGEVLNYAFLEGKLKAPKIMSRIEIDTADKRYHSESDSIHLLPSSVSGRPYHQLVFGASNIVGDLGYAIDGAFEKIYEIEKNEKQEIHISSHLFCERMVTAEEAKAVTEILIPSPSKKERFNTSYGVFLGYTIGLGKYYSAAEYPKIVEQKMRADIRHYIPYILKKINDFDLGVHSFYIYVLPFNDAEEDKKAVMEAVLEGDVDLI